MTTATEPRDQTFEIPPCCVGCGSLDWEWRVEDVRRNGGTAMVTFYCDPCL